MADMNSVIAKITDALDEAYAAAGLPNQTAQIAALQGKIDAARLAAQAAKDADAATVDGQAVLDALA